MAYETYNLTEDNDTWTGFDSPQNDDITVNGLGGADTLTAGWCSSTWLNGGEGNDVLSAGAWPGSAAMDGGAGDDLLIITGKPMLYINGGEGLDTLQLPTSGPNGPAYHVEMTDASSASASASADQGPGHVVPNATSWIALTVSGIENVIASSQEDSILCDDAANKVTGNGGKDTMDGAGGADTLLGGDGNDSITAGAGADSVTGDAGDDVLFGGSENDKLLGGDGADVLTGDAGDDFLKGDLGRDGLDGGDGADTLTGGDDKDTFRGGAGADIFVFSSAADLSRNHPDMIKDLSAEDIINLSQLDANGYKAGDGAFKIVEAFDGHRGELVLSYDADTRTTSILLDINGDQRTDKIIDAKGDHTDFDHFVL